MNKKVTIIAAVLAAAIIIAFLFLPIIPIGAMPGKMGTEFRSPTEILQGISFPENPPTKLPVCCLEFIFGWNLYIEMFVFFY